MDRARRALQLRRRLRASLSFRHGVHPPDLKELTKEAFEKLGKDKLKELGEGLLEGLLLWGML